MIPTTGRQPRRTPVVAACVVAVAVTLFASLWMSGRSPTGSGAAGAAQGSPAASPIASPAPAATPAAEPSGGRDFVYTTGAVTIRITDAGFDPSHVLSAVGHELTFTLVNTDSAPHNFSIDELDIDVDVPAGERVTVELGAPPLGEYRFYSDLAADPADRFSGRLTIFI